MQFDAYAATVPTARLWRGNEHGLAGTDAAQTNDGWTGWPAFCDEARGLDVRTDAREPAASLPWRTGRNGARQDGVEHYRAQTPLTDADITALLPIWQQGSWTLPDYGRWVARAVERGARDQDIAQPAYPAGTASMPTTGNTAAQKTGCDCETPNAKVKPPEGSVERPVIPNTRPYERWKKSSSETRR